MKTGHLCCLLLGVFVLTACNPQPKSEIDGRSLLDAIAGPDIDGMEKTLLNSALEAEKKGDFARASQLYRQLLDKRPKETAFLLGMAQSLRRQGEYDEAVRHFDLVLEQEENHAEALEGKGLSVMAKGDTVEAGKLFARVMKQDPKRWQTLNAIGILFTIKHMVDEAMAYYGEALDYSKNNASVLNNIGLSLLINKEYDKAIEALEKARLKIPASSPEKKRIDLNLALAYGMAGRLDEAQETAARHLSQAALYNNMGFYAELAKDPEVARSYLNMALMNSPVYYRRAWGNLEALGEQGAEKKE